MSVKKLQSLLDKKQIDPSKLSEEQAANLNTLFQQKALKGYNSVDEMKQERRDARSSLAKETEEAARPIETERSTFELIGEIPGAIFPFWRDRPKLKESLQSSGYTQRFGFAYPEKFLQDTENLKTATEKMERPLNKAVKGKGRIGLGVKLFNNLRNFLKNTGEKTRQILKAKKETGSYFTQPLQTELSSLKWGAAGAAAGSATYDIANAASEFASNAQLDLGEISDNELDQMPLAKRLAVKSVDAATNSLLWGGGATALFGFTGRLWRSTQKTLTGTKGMSSERLAKKASEKGIPVSLIAAADEKTFFGKLTTMLPRIFGVLPLVGNKVIKNMGDYDFTVMEHFGKHLSELGPMGYTDLLGKEFTSIVEKNYKNNMKLIDTAYKSLDDLIKNSNLTNVGVVQTKNFKKFAQEMKERLEKDYGRNFLDLAKTEPGLARLTDLDNAVVQLIKGMDATWGDTITLNQYKGAMETLNKAINQTSKNDRVTLNANELRRALSMDLAAISEKGYFEKNIANQAGFKEFVEAQGTQEAKDASKKNAKEIINSFGTRYKEANELYSRIISPYGEGMLKDSIRKTDANLFSALGELGIAGGGSVEPQKLFKLLGEITFRDGTDRTIKELKQLIGYNKTETLKDAFGKVVKDAKGNSVKVSKGKELFNAMRSRWVYDAYLKSFVDPKTYDDLLLRGSMPKQKKTTRKIADDGTIREEVTETEFAPTSPEAEKARKRAGDYRDTDEAYGFREGEVQTISADDINVNIDDLGAFDMNKFRSEIGLSSNDGDVKRRMYEIFGDGDIKKGINHVKNLDETFEILTKHYGVKTADQSTFLLRRAGLTGMSGMMKFMGLGGVLGGATAATGMAAAASPLATVIPGFLLRHFGGFLTDPNAAKRILDVYTTAEREAMFRIQKGEKTIQSALLGEGSARYGLNDVLGKGLSPRLKTNLGRLFNWMADEDEDFPGTNPDKITNKQLIEYMLNQSDTPVTIPNKKHVPGDLPESSEAHIYPESYVYKRLKPTDRTAVDQYLKGSRQAAANYAETEKIEEDTARITMNAPSGAQEAVPNPENTPQMTAPPPQQVGQQGQQGGQAQQYASLFPQDSTGIAIAQNQPRTV